MTGRSGDWRYFGTREVRLARLWAGRGGIAVHENLFRLRGHRCAHLLAQEEEVLIKAAGLVGCRPHWIQRTRTVHFDLVGEFLERALLHCGIDASLPPARVYWSDPDRFLEDTGLLD
jgi:hypothetical protein